MFSGAYSSHYLPVELPLVVTIDITSTCNETGQLRSIFLTALLTFIIYRREDLTVSLQIVGAT